MLKTLNAENVLEKGGNGLTLENLISMNPDVIVYVRSDRFAAADVNAVASLSENQVVQDVPAIKNKKIIEMDYDDVMDYGARVIDLRKSGVGKTEIKTERKQRGSTGCKNSEQAKNFAPVSAFSAREMRVSQACLTR